MLRLSELLERVRPAGSPGAAAEGDEQHRYAILEAEIADLSQHLAAFERDADRRVAEAREEAERIRRDGRRRVEQISAERADRVARARATGMAQDREDTERDTIVDAARRDAERLRRDATARIPAAASSIADSIWAVLEEGGEP